MVCAAVGVPDEDRRDVDAVGQEKQNVDDKVDEVVDFDHPPLGLQEGLDHGVPEQAPGPELERQQVLQQQVLVSVHLQKNVPKWSLVSLLDLGGKYEYFFLTGSLSRIAASFSQSFKISLCYFLAKLGNKLTVSRAMTIYT